jgi:hypothetical protein
LLVWADKQATNGTSDLHANFHLSKSGTSIGLYGPDGKAVDLVTFGPQTSDISEGRFPDGAANLYFMTASTPGKSNVLRNNSSQLGDINLNGKELTFSLLTFSGYTYQLEYKDDLNSGDWTSLGVPLAGTGASLIITNEIEFTGQRFYRLLISP